MTGEEALLSLLEGLKPRRCEGCGPEVVMVEPVIGDIELHDGSHVPAAIYQHGIADDGKPHWRRFEDLRMHAIAAREPA